MARELCQFTDSYIEYLLPFIAKEILLQKKVMSWDLCINYGFDEKKMFFKKNLKPKSICCEMEIKVSRNFTHMWNNSLHRPHRYSYLYRGGFRINLHKKLIVLRD